MNHYAAFDPYLTADRNRQARSEVYSLRLQKRLREDRDPRVSASTASIRRNRKPIWHRSGGLLEGSGKRRRRVP